MLKYLVCSDNEAHVISGEKGLYHIRPESKTNSSVTRFPTVGVLKKKKLKKIEEKIWTLTEWTVQWLRMWWFKLRWSGRREEGWGQCCKTSHKCSFNDAGITDFKTNCIILKLSPKFTKFITLIAISGKCFKASASEVKNTR